MFARLLPVLMLLGFAEGPLQAQPGKPATIARLFLESFPAGSQLDTIHLAAEDERRYRWHFYPQPTRVGMRYKEMSPRQRVLVRRLMYECMSQAGVERADQIRQLEDILRQVEKRPEGDLHRDSSRYYLAIFGTPAEDQVWGWRWEGHHISLNYRMRGNRVISATPSAWGANPGIVESGPRKGWQLFATEETAGYHFLMSLDENQRSKAIYSPQAPDEILTFVSRKAFIEGDYGLAYGDMNTRQQALFRDLLKLHLRAFSRLFADDMWLEAEKAGLEKYRFAWAGASSIEKGKAHYYRIQGPTLIIEFDNSQGTANHPHLVVRDLLHDFGEDPLLSHYRLSHPQGIPAR